MIDANDFITNIVAERCFQVKIDDALVFLALGFSEGHKSILLSFFTSLDLWIQAG